MTGGLLQDVTVVDLSRVLAGPYCTMMLAELGADVIKIERPKIGDDSRAIGPFLKDRSAYFMSLNRGKKSIALDLKNEDDKAILLRMLKHADVLVENYRPGTMEKLGLSWDFLHEHFPHLIVMSVSGFGQTGPYSDKPAYDMVVQAMGGIMSVTGEDGGHPVRVGSSVGDIVAGLFAAIGVNAALHRRNTTGVGERLDVAMLDSQVAILENAIARYAALGSVPGPIGARHPSITPFQAYQAKDGHVVIAAGNDKLFATLCETLDLPDLPNDPRFVSNATRCEHVHDLKVILEERLASQSADHWITLLDSHGIPTGPINTVDKVLSDPQVLARNMVVTAPEDTIGELKMAGNPIKVTGVDDPPRRRAAPKLDEDREEILNWLAQQEG